MIRKGMVWLLLAALLLTGCAQKPAAEQTPEAAPEAQTVEPTAQEPAAEPEVENNGGYYVRVGDTVYFRRYGSKALSDVATFAAFTESWNVSGESELMAYDTATGELTALYTETGAGPLWYGDGGFYLCEYANGDAFTAWYAPDGSGVEYLCPGMPIGVTDGGLLAVSRSDEGTGFATAYSFYRDKSLVGSWETEQYLSVAGLTDDGLFLLETDMPDETCLETFRQITPEGTEIRLGVRRDADETIYFCDIQPDRFLAADGKVTIGLGCYAGTGHFLDHAVFVEAEIGREDSLKTLEKEIDVNDNGELPYLALGEDGRVAFVPEPDGALHVGWENDELRLWEDGAWQTLAEHFAPSRDDGWGKGTAVQHLAYLDGAAYVTIADTFASPADDIGWRDASRLLAMRYLKVERDGTVSELDCVDCDAELFGFVWFIEGASCAIWRQLTSEDGEGWFDVPYAFAVPIAEDAYWDELAFDGVTGLLPGDYGEGEADYYGYPIPDAEPAGDLTLMLDRNGYATAVMRRDPAALLNIDFDVPESETAGAAARLPLERRDSDEDTPWFWARLTALADDVHVRLERTPAETNTLEDEALEAGVFIAGETIYDGTLRRGEQIALRASLPWHPEIRVSVDKGAAYGDYIFGEDNYLHWEEDNEVHPTITLAGYSLPNLRDYDGSGLREALNGAWLYRSAQTGETSALLYFGDDGAVELTRADAEESAVMTSTLDYLYAENWDAPDLLCLRSDDPVVTDALGFGGGVGDYTVEVFRTDGEELLRLTQANNGDGALGALLKDENGKWQYDFVFTRAYGVGETGARRCGLSFPAVIAKYDSAAGVCWLREAAVADRDEMLGDVWRPMANAPCLAYPISPDAAKALQGIYPMALCRVTTDKTGTITSLQDID